MWPNLARPHFDQSLGLRHSSRCDIRHRLHVDHGVKDEIRMREALHSPISRLSPASLQSDTENKDVVPKNLDSEAKFRGIHAEKLRCPQDLQKRLFALHCISIDVTWVFLRIIHRQGREICGSSFLDDVLAPGKVNKYRHIN